MFIIHIRIQLLSLLTGKLIYCPDISIHRKAFKKAFKRNVMKCFANEHFSFLYVLFFANLYHKKVLVFPKAGNQMKIIYKIEISHADFLIN